MWTVAEGADQVAVGGHCACEDGAGKDLVEVCFDGDGACSISG